VARADCIDTSPRLLATGAARRLARLLVGGAAAIFVAVGCSSGALHEAGSACSTDEDCGAGLACMGLGNQMGGTCTTVAKACTKSCVTDLDCLAVGSSYRCLPNCQGAGTCVLTRVASD
jgi:hypothetical protein